MIGSALPRSHADLDRDVEWSEHPDLRFPGRTILIGKVGTNVYGASFCGRRSVAQQAIVAAIRAGEGSL